MKRNPAGEMKLGAAALLCVCFAVSANAFTAMPSHQDVLKRTGKAVCAPPMAFARSQIGRPTLALRAADDDSKGGPLGDESDMVPRDSVDPTYFVIGGILGEYLKTFHYHLFTSIFCKSPRIHISCTTSSADYCACRLCASGISHGSSMRSFNRICS
jgi:hypothetical protein